MLYYTRLEMITTDKHSSLLGSSVSYKENEVLGIRSQVPYSQSLIFFMTYDWPQ
jgi:hypothetical protein